MMRVVLFVFVIAITICIGCAAKQYSLKGHQFSISENNVARSKNLVIDSDTRKRDAVADMKAKTYVVEPITKNKKQWILGLFKQSAAKELELDPNEWVNVTRKTRNEPVCKSLACPQDGMIEKTQMYSHPYSLAVKVFMDGGHCSGSIIGTSTVLLAAHCVYDDKTLEFSTGGIVVPGGHDKNWPHTHRSKYLFDMPFGYATIKRMVIPACYPDRSSCDYAVIEVDRPLKHDVGGRFSFGYDSVDANWPSKLSFIGYPAGNCGAVTPYYRFFTIEELTDDTIVHYLMSEGGDSGSPYYMKTDDNRVIRGVHTFGVSCECTGSGDNRVCAGKLTAGGVRLTKSRFDFIKKYRDKYDETLKSNKPQIMEFIDDYISGISAPKSVSPANPVAGTSITVKYALFNGGAVQSNSITASYYLSTDLYYHTSDIAIKENVHVDDGLKTYSYLTVEQHLNLPTSITGGEYYLIVKYSSSGMYHNDFTEIVVGSVKVFPPDCNANTCRFCTDIASCEWCSSSNSCQSQTETCTGTAVTSASSCPACSTYSSCDTCISELDCGWCGEDNKCHDGGFSGIDSGTCDEWSYVDCTAQKELDQRKKTCEGLSSSCEKCIDSDFCGWCGSLDGVKCVPGDDSQPETGSCEGSWSWSECPITVDPCLEKKSCGDCTNTWNCGWCESDSKCLTGSSSGPQSGSCDNWDYYVSDCAGETTDSCTNFNSCDDCLKDEKCGWCHTDSKCVAGTTNGPVEDGKTCTEWSIDLCDTKIDTTEDRDSGDGKSDGNSADGGDSGNVGDGGSSDGGDSDDSDSDDGDSDDSDSDDDGGSSSGGCFASDSIVRVRNQDGGISSKLLSNLIVGDYVESVDSNMQRTFSKVYYIAHADTSNSVQMVEISYKLPNSGVIKSIRMTATHLLFVALASTPEKMELRTAKTVQTDQWISILTDDGKQLIVKVIRVSNTVASVRHPLTDNHRIVVSGVASSVHVLNDEFYRIATSPLRLASTYLPDLLFSKIGKIVVDALISGTDFIEEFLINQQ